MNHPFERIVTVPEPEKSFLAAPSISITTPVPVSLPRNVNFDVAANIDPAVTDDKLSGKLIAFQGPATDNFAHVSVTVTGNVATFTFKIPNFLTSNPAQSTTARPYLLVVTMKEDGMAITSDNWPGRPVGL